MFGPGDSWRDLWNLGVSGSSGYGREVVVITRPEVVEAVG